MSEEQLKYYNDFNESDFNEILSKREFINNSSDKKKQHIHQEPTQMLIRNFISKNTIYDNLLLYNNLGTGKCHKRDTPILMYNGKIKMVQDIEIGDLLMGDDSTPRQVLSLARGQDNMYDIIPVKGEKYTVNEEHILCLKVSGYPRIANHKGNKNFNIEWIENNKYKSKTFTYNKSNKLEQQERAYDFYNDIKEKGNKQIIEISVKDYLQLSKSKRTMLKGYKCGVNFEDKEVLFNPYILGYWLGDGTGRGSCITTQESCVLDYFRKHLPTYNLYLSKLKSNYSYGITGNGKYGGNLFLTTLKQLNLINNKHIPYMYKCNNRQVRLQLLAGILDADGHYDSGGFELTQSYEKENLINDIVYLVRSLGFSCYKNLKNTTWIYKGEKKYGKAWRIMIYGNGIEEIPTVCKRKRAKPRKQIKDPLVTGISVQYVGRDDYYGFTLDGNCRYLMGDFTVTHNTCTSISVAEGFKEYVSNMGRKIVVLVKNKNIQKNFMDELLSKCTNDEYIDSNQRRIYSGEIQYKNSDVMRNEIILKATKEINRYYQFITYGTFVNRVLGTKEFIKDEYGKNTKRVKKIDGEMVRKKPKDEIKNLSNSVIIVDEAHNITDNDIYKSLFKVLSKSYNTRLLLLTATPIYDNPTEIFELSNLININRPHLQFPTGNKLFNINLEDQDIYEDIPDIEEIPIETEQENEENEENDIEQNIIQTPIDQQEFEEVEQDIDETFSEEIIEDKETPSSQQVMTSTKSIFDFTEPFLMKTQSEYINSNALKGGIVSLTDNGKSSLMKALYGKVSYLRENTETNPKKIVMGRALIPNRTGSTNVVYCQMSLDQYRTYLKALFSDVNTDSKYDLSDVIKQIESQENTLEDIVSVSKTGSLYKNSNDASTMSYPDDLYGKDGFLKIFSKSGSSWSLNKEYKNVLTTKLEQYSNKLYKLLNNIKDPKTGNVFIYSNYVNYGGTSLIKQVLLNNGFYEFKGKQNVTEDKMYKYFIVFDDSTSIERRERYKRVFNSDDNKYGKYIRVIIGSPIISEGITLKAVRQVHILEPYWNMSKVNQIIGRAVRNYSHDLLKPEERTVEIYKYISVHYKSNQPINDILRSSNDLKDFFIDREKYILSEEKDRTNKVVERLLKQISFDCSLNLSRNISSETLIPGSPECDYTDCEQKCLIEPQNETVIDNSTYNMYLKFFDEFDIYYVLETIKDLFKTYFIWSLDDIKTHIKKLEPLITDQAIYTTLNYITKDKVYMVDKYNRQGYIINKADYYIFNSSDIDIETSFYSKILDFSVDKNKYTLNEFTKQNIDVDLFEKDSKKSKLREVTTTQTQDILSPSDIEFNETIEQTYNIYGTFRKKKDKSDLWQHKYGKIDNTFRIVDLQNTQTIKKQKDERKVITGKAIHSFHKPELAKMSNTLNIPVKPGFDKEQLGENIKQFLIENNRVLK
jgi:hypothetical protein